MTTKQLIKRTLVTGGSIIAVLLVVLCVHIYLATRPKPVTADTRAIIKIDFKQDITDADADKINTWLHKQKGVENVSCNAANDFAVAIVHPALYNPDQLVSDLETSLNYKAKRFIPSQKDMQNGCPVATTSWTYKIYNYFSRI